MGAGNEGIGLTVNKALLLVKAEVEKAQKAHKPFNSCHEGWAVIYEELVKELGDEVFRKEKFWPGLTLEAIQTAAMAVRFLVDLCPDPSKLGAYA